MNRFSFLMILSLLVVVVGGVILGCNAHMTPWMNQPPPPGPGAATYIGSAACTGCHTTIYNTWEESGHPYKLNKVSGGPPTYPFSSVPDTPAIAEWSDVTYVIGGYFWKARFIGNDGNIITGQLGDGVQYNLADGSWAEYHPGEQKPYNCGKCHTTGWQTLDDNGGIHQDGLQGIEGTWEETGIGCESCHGPGSNHADAPSAANINDPVTAVDCSDCHTRDSERKILVSGDLVRHHEQYDEFSHSPHAASLTCMDCHDPHASTVNDAQALGTGLVADCTDCHAAADHQVTGSMAALSCTDCHMPAGAKSAISTGDGAHKKGDVHNHIWAVDTTGVALDGGYFDTDGSATWIKEDAGGQVKLNLAWACMQCHDGTSATEISDYNLLAARADGIHEPPVVQANYVGSSSCGGCHTGIYDTWIESGHPYKLNKASGGPPTYPFSSVPNTPAIATWADVTYVIGGYGWKARFIGTDGYIITGQPGDGVQYNLADGSWAEYHPGEQKPYNCGKCHTTGWQTLEENGGVHQDSLEGIEGTWEETGVGCEACHGPGENHIAGPSTTNINKDTSAALCGRCHTRDSENKILVSGDLVRHHEQYDEFLHSPHSDALTCGSCHDPHAGVAYDAQAMGTGVTASCTDCHAAASHQVSGSMSTLACTDCHMPMAAKSALSSGTGLHKKGDLHNHIFAIDSTGIALDGGYYDTDGSNTWIAMDGQGKVKLNLAWACMTCHDGTDAFEMTSYTMAAGKAAGIHN